MLEEADDWKMCFLSHPLHENAIWQPKPTNREAGDVQNQPKENSHYFIILLKTKSFLKLLKVSVDL